MLDKLLDLVFGFNEFEKTKIDMRFNEIKIILPEIKIRELKDFEILERIIFKIKEQLRLKSSNLNSIIRDSKKKLTKADVLSIIENLNKIKYEFLNKAFNLIDSEKQEKLNLVHTKTDFGIKEEDDIKNNDENIQNSKVLTNYSNEDSLLIKGNDDFDIFLNNGKQAYVLVNFKQSVNYVLIRDLSTIVFEIFGSHGTNVIIEDNNVLIIPRFQDDNLFSLPQTQVDVEEIYKKLLEEISNKNLGISKDIKNEEIKEEFISISPNTPRVDSKHSSKNKDESLDSLLAKDTKPDFEPKPNPRSDDSVIEVIKDENKVEIEKKDQEDEIVIEKKVQEEKKESKSNQNKQTEVIKEEIEKPKPEIEKKPKEIPRKAIDNFKFEVYRDDKIVVFFKEDSKVLGELCIGSIYGEEIKDVEQNTFTYMMIFSKVFSSLLFEVIQSHGTNLIYDFDGKYMRIIPRMQNDNLGINWAGTQQTDDFLDDVRKKLMDTMSSALSEDKSQEEPKEEPLKEKSKENKKEKAEYILESLQRIP